MKLGKSRDSIGNGLSSNFVEYLGKSQDYVGNTLRLGPDGNGNAAWTGKKEVRWSKSRRPKNHIEKRKAERPLRQMETGSRRRKQETGSCMQKYKKMPICGKMESAIACTIQ